jgi:hypothetical protein
MTDMITQKEKVNEDLAPNEIKFCFKPSKALTDRKPEYIKYYFKLTDDDRKEIKNKFNLGKDSNEFRHKFDADAGTFAKEIRKRELVVRLKKKKILGYRKELDIANVKLSDLY